ncbi:hypothetical protein [Aliiglaciecola sp. LCG003]|uniref:hypothetical protein n=1 Tax=Aliiglaciecola sp. LCG003 TaxID=3053655 RepID=UPI0025723B6F|nr:hypothetical protein [Aliiglaciecola sp. LCG003]WJG09097.1 hypothetical protein QR722_17485 [Aliiglaciecola sp. LCG003]
MKKVKIILVSICLIAGVTAVNAQAESISEAMKNCGQVQNSLKRLVCYDKIINDMNRYGGLDDLMSVPAPLPSRSSTKIPENVSDAKVAAVVAPVAEKDDFGMEHRQTNENNPDKIYAKVTGLSKGAYKKYVITLDNGQVWNQTEGGSFSLEEGEAVYIERGALGSFYLSKDDINRRLRVKRVK